MYEIKFEQRETELPEMHDREINEMLADLCCAYTDEQAADLIILPNKIEIAIHDKEQLQENLIKFKAKWFHSVPSHQMSRCKRIIENIQGELNNKLSFILREFDYIKQEKEDHGRDKKKN